VLGRDADGFPQTSSYVEIADLADAVRTVETRTDAQTVRDLLSEVDDEGMAATTLADTAFGSHSKRAMAHLWAVKDEVPFVQLQNRLYVSEPEQDAT
jgi:hypothetical protein